MEISNAALIVCSVIALGTVVIGFVALAKANIRGWAAVYWSLVLLTPIVGLIYFLMHQAMSREVKRREGM